MVTFAKAQQLHPDGQAAAQTGGGQTNTPGEDLVVATLFKFCAVFTQTWSRNNKNLFQEFCMSYIISNCKYRIHTRVVLGEKTTKQDAMHDN